MLRKPREIIFSARITFYHDVSHQGQVLREEIQHPDWNGDKFDLDLRRSIESELPAELEQIYGFGVRTRVISIKPGSIEIFFGAVLTALGIFSSYADFFGSINLIKRHARRITELYFRNYGINASTAVEVLFPALPDPNDLDPFRRLRRHLGPFSEDFRWLAGSFSRGSAPRDGLFWWLLVCNILLTFALVALVSSAVVKTYF